MRAILSPNTGLRREKAFFGKISLLNSMSWQGLTPERPEREGALAENPEYKFRPTFSPAFPKTLGSFLENLPFLLIPRAAKPSPEY